MYQSDLSLIKKMNIHSDAIIINQGNHDELKTFIHESRYNIIWDSCSERGIGRSRNRALMKASSDIVLFADDDVVYYNNYSDIVTKEFNQNPKADVILFNIDSLNPNRPEFINKKNTKVHIFNCLRYGACRIAIKRTSLLKANIFFSLLFGGGAKYQAGEDNLFIVSCLKNKLRCYASSKSLGTVAQSESTWFKGYDDKYFFDRGALFQAMFGISGLFLLPLFEIKKRNFKSIIHNTLIGWKGFLSFGKN